MKFSEADAADGYLIRAYEKGRIQVGDRSYGTSLIIAPDRIICDWRPQSTDDLAAADFAPVLALEPEIILLGTGAEQVFPDPPAYKDVVARRVGLEIMDTGAACRTYNILMSEGRRVAAALMMI